MVGLLGNEEAVGSFLLAGWGERAPTCNWRCVTEVTKDVEKLWSEMIEEPRVAVLLVSGVPECRSLIDAYEGPVTVVEIPNGDEPRVSCSVYEPYSGWKSEVSMEDLDDLDPLDDARGAKRVDELVAAVFRLATLERRQDSAKTALSFKLQILNAATTEIADIVQRNPRGPRHLVRALNRQRTMMVDVGPAFPFLAGLALTLLDRCMATSDVDAILTSMMLAQSFYRTRSSGREYLKSAIQSHPVWADHHFWRDALQSCVRKQQRGFVDPPLDDHHFDDDYDDDHDFRHDSVPSAATSSSDHSQESFFFQRRTTNGKKPLVGNLYLPQPKGGEVCCGQGRPPSSTTSSKTPPRTKRKAKRNTDQPPPPATPPPSQTPVPFKHPSPTASSWVVAPLYAVCLPQTLRYSHDDHVQHQVALWSQLGGIVHAMLEFGVAADNVRTFVNVVCDEHALAQAQRDVILDHIDLVQGISNPVPAVDELLPTTAVDVGGAAEGASKENEAPPPSSFIMDRRRPTAEDILPPSSTGTDDIL